jgi:hypothetical protein
MPNSREYLLELLKHLIDRKVMFIVCGGLAAVLHGKDLLDIAELKRIKESQ